MNFKLMNNTKAQIFNKSRDIAAAVVSGGDVLEVARSITQLVWLFDEYTRRHIEEQQEINSLKIRQLKQYICNKQPLKIRIEFSKHETEVNWTNNQLQKVHGAVFIEDMVASLVIGLRAHKKHPEFWAIAGRAYEEAKAVVT